MFRQSEMFFFRPSFTTIFFIYLLSLSIIIQFKPTASKDFDYDVDLIIMGAGISGFACAKELRKNGVTNFFILEGRNTSGGRFQSTRIGNVTVELGPNWIHGTENNPVYDLIRRFGIRGQHEDTSSIMSKNIDGKDITTAFRKRQQILKKTMASLDSSRYSNLSLREALTLNGWTNRTAIDNLVEYVVIDDMEGVPPELLSVSHFVKQSGINTKLGRQFFITEQNGYKKLIDGLEELALQGDSTKLKLDHEVKKIHWNKYGVRVETSNGKVFTAKVLISTASNGVYHNSPHLFYPKLPKWKQDALWKFKMATYTKIFLKFPYRFWDNVEYIFYAAEKRGTFPVWQSLDAGNRYNKNTNMLLLPVTGQESYRVEQMKENDLIKEIMSQVMSVYGPNVPWPTDIVVPKWSSKEHFYGSFTYLPAFTSHADFVALRANVGPIFFAGEATHEVHQSYIHGAYFEGINRACDAIQALRGFLDVSNGQFDYNYYDSCLRDSCNCCSK